MVIKETMCKMIETAESFGRVSSSNSHFVLGIPEFQTLFGELVRSYSIFPEKAAEEAEEIVNMAREMGQNVFAGLYYGIRMEVSSSCVGIHLYFGEGNRITRNPLNSHPRREEPKESQSDLVLGLVGAIRDVLDQIEGVLRG